jgi:hypothetical protein
MTTSNARPRSLTGWRLSNAVTLVLVVVFNGLASSGTLSGNSVGAIANRFSSSFLPADYVFSIWGLIYLGLLAFTVFQAVGGPRSARAVECLGPWWLVSSALNVTWLTSFCFAQFGLAMVAMLGLLVTLIIISERLRPLTNAGTLAERVFVAWPFSIYLAWISVALIANTFQYAHVVEWAGLGVPEHTWAAVMMLVATLLGWVLVAARRLWLFPLVVGWALWGIGVRFENVPALHTPALVLVPLGVAVGLAAAAVLARSRVATRPA